MLILDCINTLAVSVDRMTIERAKHFCNLYEALYVVICDFDDPVPMDIMLSCKELKERIYEIRILRNSITDYETGKAVTLNKALEVLGDN